MFPTEHHSLEDFLILFFVLDIITVRGKLNVILNLEGVFMRYTLRLRVFFLSFFFIDLPYCVIDDDGWVYTI